MQVGQPSLTARSAAVHRAVHQVLEQGRIFTDPLAFRILGEEPSVLVRDSEQEPIRRRMRLFVAIRTRFAEDSLSAAVATGFRQLVVLGAGLDTFGYRHAFPQLRVYEVDHPATQAWKQQRLIESGIEVPTSLTFAPVDFERQTLAQGLAAVGFDSEQQTFFTWLGVVPYLTQDSIWSTLSYIAGLPAGAQVVFDYGNPPDSLAAESRSLHDVNAQRVAELGEPWITFFQSETIRTKLQDLGFSEIEDLGPTEIAARYFPGRAARSSGHGGHVVRAATRR